MVAVPSLGETIPKRIQKVDYFMSPFEKWCNVIVFNTESEDDADE